MLSATSVRLQSAALVGAVGVGVTVSAGLLSGWSAAIPCAVMGLALVGLRGAIGRTERELRRKQNDAEVERRVLVSLETELENLNKKVRKRETELLEAVGTVEMSREAYRIASMRFEELFAGFPVPTFSYDHDGQIFEWNRAAEVLTGIEAKDAFGRDVTDVFAPSPEFADFHREIRRVFTGDSISGTERTLNLGEAGVRHLVCNSFPLRTVGRKISGGVTALLDVTAHIAAEHKFRTLFDQANDAYLVLSRQGTILDANAQASLFLGGDADAVLAGRPMADFIPKDDQRAHAMFLRKAARREIARREWLYQGSDGEKLEVDVAISGNTLAGEPVVLMQIHDLGERKRFESELQTAVGELERAQSIGQIGSWEVDLRTGRFSLSQEMYRVCGWPEDKPLPSTRDFVRLAHIDDQEAMLDAMREASRTGENRELHHRLVRRDGAVRYAISQLHPIPAEHKMVGTIQDITERKLEEMRVLESESKFRTVVASVDAGLMVVDSDLVVQMHNPSSTRLLDLPTEPHQGYCLPNDVIMYDLEMRPVMFEDQPVARALYGGHTIRNLILGRKHEGGMAWLSFSAAPVRIPGLDTVGSAVISFADVTDQLEYQQKMLRLAEDLEKKNRELRGANAKLQRLATTDGLTSLSNHRSFQEFLDAHCAEHAPADLSILMLDVDKFKDFNDSFGHRAGDEVLRRVAAVLRDHCRKGDMAARYGGEEFVLVLPHADAGKACEIAERLREAIATEDWLHRPVTISVGVATRIGNMAPHDLIETADQALYMSKRTGRNRVTHASALSKAA